MYSPCAKPFILGLVALVCLCVLKSSRKFIWKPSCVREPGFELFRPSEPTEGETSLIIPLSEGSNQLIPEPSIAPVYGGGFIVCLWSSRHRSEFDLCMRLRGGFGVWYASPLPSMTLSDRSESCRMLFNLLE